MASDTAFVGDIPKIYDSHMRPFFFESFAKDLAKRLLNLNPSSLLTLACGTGADTRAAKDALPNANVVATDLNPGMLEVAKTKFAPNEIKFEVVDAQSLPFPDASFDAVTCQFGLMFVPDKDAAISEALRVLTSGGHLICTVWDELSLNPASEIAHDLALETCKSNPPLFWLTPFGYNDKVELKSLFERNGFQEVTIDVVKNSTVIDDPSRLAYALIYGTPAYGFLNEHPDVDLGQFERELAHRIEASLEPDRTTSRQALVVTGRKI